MPNKKFIGFKYSYLDPQEQRSNGVQFWRIHKDKIKKKRNERCAWYF